MSLGWEYFQQNKISGMKNKMKREINRVKKQENKNRNGTSAHVLGLNP